MTKAFWRLLNKQDKAHLSEWGILTVRDFKNTRRDQLRSEEIYRQQGLEGAMATTCEHCRKIAKRVGMR